MSVERLIEIEEAKKEVLEYLGKVKRKGIKNLVKDLDKLGYFDAPASTMHHLNFQGGLVIHSKNVLKTALSTWKALNMEETQGITEESVIIASLFHDLAKGSYNGVHEYQPNFLKGGVISDKKPWVRSKERPKVEHSILGAIMVSKYIDLTDDELCAIIYHDGGYIAHFREFYGGENPLWLLIHFSDMYNAHFIESVGSESEE
jgi:hypothetical protein